MLLGPSGSGKSTLALCLNGLIPHIVGGYSRGQVTVAELDCNQTPVSGLAQEVGIVFQDPEAQFVTMTVEEEIAFGLENLCVPPQEMDKRIQDALEQVDMASYRRRRVDMLSGGEKQRLALAALLGMKPGILVFDEPTANLDPIGTRQVFDTIACLKETGCYTIVIIEHKLDDLMHLIDRVVALTGEGKVLADGEPHLVFDEQGEFLLEHGIWMPQVVSLAHRLSSRGLFLDPFPITLSEAEHALLKVDSSFKSNRNHAEIDTIDKVKNLAIEVRDLSFTYANNTVLKNINLRIPQGDFLAIVGANGAGKTTLAQHLIDVLHPPSGSVFLGGNDVTSISARDLIRRVGYVFQNPEHQFITNSVAQEIGFGLRLIGESEEDIENRVTQLLSEFGLANLAKANPFTLSHGEKRRLSVATMLAVGQETLVLDEPTFGQDQRNATALMQLLNELHKAGRTVIIITHDMNLVAEYARHVAVMSAGEILFHGTVAEVFSSPELLAQARLTLPPMVELSRRLPQDYSELRDLYTLDEFLEAIASSSLREVSN